MENDQYAFVLGALARIDKKVDMMNESFQEVKIELIHMKEDIDEARADISELKQYNSHYIDKQVEKMDDEFEDEFDI